MIEGYLLEREPLVLVFVLVDGEIGPTKLDLQMLAWLQANAVPYQIVATKLDKVKPSKLAGRRQQLARACSLDEDDVLWVSASKGHRDRPPASPRQRHVDGLTKMNPYVLRQVHHVASRPPRGVVCETIVAGTGPDPTKPHS